MALELGWKFKRIPTMIGRLPSTRIGERSKRDVGEREVTKVRIVRETGRQVTGEDGDDELVVRIGRSPCEALRAGRQ